MDSTELRDLWKAPELVSILSRRDIAAVFRFAQSCGISQRWIARATKQKPSEISAVLAGRTVVSYNVFANIADGLGIPRGLMGLAYTDADGNYQDPPRGEDDAPPGMKVVIFAPAVTGEAGEQSPVTRKQVLDKTTMEALLAMALTIPRALIRVVPLWDGRYVTVLRLARRMSVREFGAHLGVSDRMVSKWEEGDGSVRPRPVNQAALDSSLSMLTPDERARFSALVDMRVRPVDPGEPA